MPTAIEGDLLDTALEILRVHQPDELGGSRFCIGCIDVWGIAWIHPCTQAEWAALVVAESKETDAMIIEYTHPEDDNPPPAPPHPDAPDSGPPPSGG